METHYYASVGNFFFAPRDKGVTLFSYSEDTGALHECSHTDSFVAAGQQYVDSRRGIVYVVDEVESRDGRPGGYIRAYSLNADTQQLIFINELPTLGAFPCAVVGDASGKYLVVVHHAEIFHANKIITRDDGTFAAETVYDDTCVDLIRLNPDGSLNSIADIVLTSDDTQGQGGIMSRLHSVVADPSGNLFIVCDKGTDKILTFGIDRDNDRLRLLSIHHTEPGLAPRYGVFHPTLPLFYGNNEKQAILVAYGYTEDGTLTECERLRLLDETEFPEEKVEASDVVIAPDAHTMYVSVRGANEIIAVHLAGNGEMTLLQRISSEGINPRGLALSPDGAYVYALNMVSGNISVFTVENDGTLRFTGQSIPANCPANMAFIRA